MENKTIKKSGVSSKVSKNSKEQRISLKERFKLEEEEFDRLTATFNVSTKKNDKAPITESSEIIEN